MKFIHKENHIAYKFQNFNITLNRCLSTSDIITLYIPYVISIQFTFNTLNNFFKNVLPNRGMFYLDYCDVNHVLYACLLTVDLYISFQFLGWWHIRNDPTVKQLLFISKEQRK